MKLDTFFVGVIDFFAALVPGVVCGALVLLWTQINVAPAITLLGGKAATFAPVSILLVGGYLFGQMLNAVGSFVLDPVYDLFYDPTHGRFVRNAPPGQSNASNTPGTATDASVSSLPRSGLLHWLRRTVADLIETDTDARKLEVIKQLDALSHVIPSGGSAYQRARAYLELFMPTAFRSIEALEAEQKLYRSLTVGLVVLAVLAALFGHGALLATLLAGAALLCLLRYIARRRKGVNMTYTYFALRDARPSSPPASGER